MTHSDHKLIVGLLVRDLEATVGLGHESLVNDAARHICTFADDPPDFEQRLVDDVQQCMHDTFTDTSWPRCPEHPNHPLWYSDGWWRCKQTGRTVAPLGGLTA